MDSLSLTKPLLIQIIGKPGAGKSFFAGRFSEIFGSPVVSVDRISYELGVADPLEEAALQASKRISQYQIEELLKTKKTIIVDGGCNAKTDRQQLNKQAKKLGYEPLVVWVQADEAICKSRSIKRNSSRDDDKYNQSMSPEQFEGLAKRLTEPRHENYIVISGRHTFNAQAKAVLRKIAMPMQAKTEVAAIQTANIDGPNIPPRPDITRRSVIIN